MTIELKLTRPAYLGQVFLVVDHAIDEKVRLRLAEAEECFSSLISAQVKSTNVDASAPPDVPRLTLADNHKNLSLAPTRMQFAFSFEPGFNVAKAFQVIQKSAAAFFLAASKFQHLDERTQIGFVLHVNQPCEEPKELMAQYMADKLYAGPVLGEFATFDLRLGFQTSANLYKNFAFNLYELKEMRLQAAKPGATSILVNIKDVPTREIGVATVLDINNRPRLSDPAVSSSEFSFEHTANDIIDGMHEMLTTERFGFLPLKSVDLQDEK